MRQSGSDRGIPWRYLEDFFARSPYQPLEVTPPDSSAPLRCAQDDHEIPRQMVSSGRHPADAFLPAPVCRHDPRRVIQQDAPASHAIAGDPAMRFRTVQIVAARSVMAAL